MFLRILRKYGKGFSILTLVVFSINVFGPSVALAIDGPKQPEVKTFTPVSTQDMVDLFTGNYNYNIPLIDVGGYPINISYTANPSMEQDASWVGLGWNINVGNIDRNMRGLPDDFSGDSIVKVRKKKINQTMGVTGSVSIADLEVFGLELGKLGLSGGASLGVYQNNYTGSGSTVGLSIGLDLAMADAGKDEKTQDLGSSFGVGVNASSNTDEGLTISPSVSFTSKTKKEDGMSENGSFSLGTSFNTQKGWKDVTFSASVPVQEQNGATLRSLTIPGTTISFAQPAMPPVISMPTFSMGMSFNASFGGEVFGVHPKAKIKAYYSQQSLKDDISPPLPVPVSNSNILVPGFITGEDVPWNLFLNIPNLTKDKAKVILPAYGYLYSQNAQTDKVLFDFNREKEGPFTMNRPNLPIPNFTHDVYNVTGQGIAGMYRPFRSDIGVLHDPAAVSSSGNLDFPGIEVGGGNAVHVGTNFAVTVSNSKSGKWSNDVTDVLGFKGFDASKPDYQPYYFKQAGEKTADFSSDFFDRTGGFDPVRVKLGTDLLSIVEAAVDPGGFFSMDATNADKTFVKENLRNPDGEKDITSDPKAYRQPRSQDVQFLNAYEAQNFGLEKDIPRYPLNTFTMQSNGTYKADYGSSRVYASYGRMPHHISEISAVRPDGNRYVYGVPVYNRYQKDVSFAIECDGFKNGEPDCARGLVPYSAGQDNSVANNNNGIDHHFDSQETPGYAHSFLLTAILSDDYADVKGDGPSDDDLGSYTKFNYVRTDMENQWRAPFEQNTANLFAGFNSDKNDGRASYAYGKRELCYLHSVVTKTHVAEFILADRQDAAGVSGEDGGLGSGRMKKLVRIDLFSKADKLKQVRTNGAYKAVPLKSVHFVYDYSLCRNLPSNTGNTDTDINVQNEKGKLTLRKIYFTYQNSNKARLSPYEFEYGYNNPSSYNNIFSGQTINPDFSEKAQDRWGTFKPQSEQSTGSCETLRTNTDFPYTDQPYTPQDKANADLNAAAWNLTKITLPSGAIIDILYESDDYAFVQNRPAMQMFSIAGITDNLNTVNLPADPNVNVAVGKYVFFKLPQTIQGSISQANANGVIRDRYLKAMASQQEKLYFRCFADMQNTSNNNADQYDYVPGYADIDISGNDGFGAYKSAGGNYDYGFVKIKAVKAGSNNLNPITKSAINMAKMNLPLLLKKHDQNVGCNDGFTQDLEKLIFNTLNIIGTIGDNIAQTYQTITSDFSFGKNIRLHKSMIRLYNPYQNKLGGGSRVKRIFVSDDWNTMTGNGSASIYGQEYTYTRPDGAGGLMSAGVASYEPITGGEENPFRQPVFFDEKRLGVPDEEFFLEMPMGESFFPGPSVGYSRVTVRDISVSDAGSITYNQTGKVVNEFYTSKDFPTRADDTHLDYHPQRPSPVAQILKVNVEDYVTVSQGYVVELNDMHGKPRSVNVYQESSASAAKDEVPLTSVTYVYKTDPATGRLDNNVQVLNRTAVTNKNAFIENRLIGVDYDFITDFRENKSDIQVLGLEGNLETFFAAIFPILVPIVLPDVETEHVTFHSAVTSKVINRYGILEKTITQDLGKQDTLRNVLYDAETGDVLLAQNKNAFNDSVYVFKYPAHFAYDRMGPAYKNSGTMVRTSSITTVTNASAFFTTGDELLAYNIDSANAKKPAYFKGWVHSITGDQLEIIDKDGFPLKQTGGEGRYIIKVIRSGRRNLQTKSIGTIMTLKNPLVDTNNDGQMDNLAFDKVLDAQAIEFDDQWKVFCNCNENKPDPIPVVR